MIDLGNGRTAGENPKRSQKVTKTGGGGKGFSDRLLVDLEAGSAALLEF
jgi:hypothetical protein